jgi:hypothetical protein
MKKAWFLVGANLVVAVLVILFLLEIMMALAVLAPYVTTWPLPILLACGVLISVVAMRALRRIERGKARLFGDLLNGSAFALYVLVVVAIGWDFFSATKERFIIPEDYQGEVYVVHGVAGGAGEERSFYRTETYRIPKNGVLLSQVPMNTSGTRPEYFYESNDGRLTKIKNAWYSTIQRTPENLADNKNVGMYFPRTAGGADDRGCKWSADLFEIGTPSYLLANHPPIDLNAYLKSYSASCVTH